MNKTDSLLWAERLREAIRILPANADIYGWELAYSREANGKALSIHLSAPVDWSPVISGTHFSGWTEMKIALTPFATAWWAKDDEVNGNDDG